jgi:hypothetical protein
MAVDKIQIDYDFLIEYFNTELNVIGATTNQTLRTVTTHNDTNTKYVRKFGKTLSVTGCTNASNMPAGMTVSIEALDGTFLGSKTGSGSFTPGSTTTAQGVLVDIIAGASPGVIPSTITLTLTGYGALVANFPTETVSALDSIRFYISETGSTYYDSEMKYGGARHTPTGTSSLPYKDISSAVSALGGAFTIVAVLDSATYDEEVDLNVASMTLQSVLGETPTITKGTGARETREVEHDGNNTDTIYVSLSGSDSGSGTYQDPYLTIQYAENNMGGRTYINIMDSETYDETINVDIAISIEPIYGKTPTIINTLSASSGSYCIKLSHANANVYGFEINGKNKHYCIFSEIVNYTGDIKNNSCYNGRLYNIFYGSASPFFNGNIESNISYNTTSAGIYFTVSAQCSGTITKNIIYNTGIGIDLWMVGGGGTNIADTAINNNLIYNNNVTNASGIRIRTSFTYAGVCENNTLWNNYYGIQVQITTFTGSFRDIIVYNSTLSDLYRPVGGIVTITESNYGTNDGWTIGSGNITTDPEFCQTAITPYQFGISSNSGAYRADTSSDDMGMHLRILEYNESDVTVNGFYIHGQNQYNNGVYILDSADHTGCSLKWCNVYNFQGIGVDIYDDSTNTEFFILNSKIYNNGNGIKLNYGGNTIQESIIYKNTVFGIHANQADQTFNHVISFQNDYGFYFKSNSIGVIFTNNISNSNSLYGVYSESSTIVSYSNITDGVNSFIDISDTSNINVNPLFININDGLEDFNIKTKETNILDSNGNIIDQYDTNSLCKDASDGVLYNDIGAYGVNRGINDQAWKKYVFENNPTNLDDQNKPKGTIENNDALGSSSSWAEAHKNIFPLLWAENQYSTETQRKKVKYFNSLRPSRELGKNKNNTRIRFKRLPVTFIQTGTSATLSGTTLTDTAKTLVEDEVKGYYVGLKFATRTNFSINVSAKTATSTGAGWTVNQWVGYFFKYNGYTYYIKSNTATILTLSDPYNTLVTASGETLSIEKYFEIKTNNTDTDFTLLDPNSELIDGTYDYYIDFAMTRAKVQDFNSTQPLYNPNGVKTGYSLTLETI